MIDYKNELNDVQYQAVVYTNGPELVLAGAGSGKTRVLTYKIAYLLEQGIHPRQIIALTFTNKAAKEMTNRLISLVGQSAIQGLNIGTFHSIFAKILRREIRNGYFKTTFTDKFDIIDADDSVSEIKKIIKEMQLSDNYSAEEVAERISKAKNMMITPDNYGRSSLYADDINRKRGKIDDIYKAYSLLLRQSNKMDFDDILLNTYLYFRDNKERRQQCSAFLKYCLVDEYQDTNLIQKAIIMFLTEANNRLFVVGDDAQSIYSFRGAIIGNILHFEKDYPDFVEFKLEENYRSTKTIVGASNSLIAKNAHQRPKKVFSNNEQGSDIVCVRKISDKQEAEFITSTIIELVQEQKYNYGDFAILYRNNSLSRMIEKILLSRRITPVIYGGVGFFQRKEIKDLFAYFRFVIHQDDISLERIINFPKRDIGDNTVAKLKAIAKNCNTSLWGVISSPTLYQAAIKRQKSRDNLVKFVGMVNKWRGMDLINASRVAQTIIDDTKIIEAYKDEDLEKGTTKVDNVFQLIRDIIEFVDERRNANEGVSLSDYIIDRALFTDEDDKDKTEKDGVSVKLMTVHKSKGLEFPVVFVAGMDEGIFPCQQSLMTEYDVEEERRLCYVAMTRAKKELYLTGVMNRFIHGENRQLEPSRFIGNISEEYKINVRF